MKGLLARKLGMTQLFNPDGTTAAVTVLEAGPCKVLGLRTKEKDGYSAVRIAFEPVNENKRNAPINGEFKKANLNPHRNIVEIRNVDGLEAGQDLTAEIFKAGELVDVTSTSKGKPSTLFRRIGRAQRRGRPARCDLQREAEHPRDAPGLPPPARERASRHGQHQDSRHRPGWWRQALPPERHRPRAPRQHPRA